MRICAPAFARIRDANGRYCLLVNKGRLKRGKGRILTPVGGGLAATIEGQNYLVSLGATDFEDGLDLRFRLPDNRVDDVIAWFGQRRQRETSVLRELAEELGEETDLLSDLEVLEATEQFAGPARYNGVTTREVPEQKTLYLIEVFNVTLSPPVMGKLLAASTIPVADRWMYFVTDDEIRAEITHEGVRIGRISKSLL